MENIEQKDGQLADNLTEFEIDGLVKSTYFKIATWHNEDASTISLKSLSLEMVEDIAGAVFKHLGLTYTSAIKMDEDTKIRLEEARKLESERRRAELEKRFYQTYTANPTFGKNVNEMTDEELFVEIERRRSQQK